MDKYEKLKTYVLEKISEIANCEKCNVTDHEMNHLYDIEDYINKIENE